MWFFFFACVTNNIFWMSYSFVIFPGQHQNKSADYCSCLHIESRVVHGCGLSVKKFSTNCCENIKGELRLFMSSFILTGIDIFSNNARYWLIRTNIMKIIPTWLSTTVATEFFSLSAYCFEFLPSSHYCSSLSLALCSCINSCNMVVEAFFMILIKSLLLFSSPQTSD